MARVALGDRLADWDTKAPLVFPSIEGRKNRAYLFFVQQALPARATRNQYLAVIAQLETSYGTFETPLECKYFPGFVGLAFSVAIPNADWDRDVSVQITLLPKEFKPRSATEKQIEIELSYEDDALRGVVFPIG